MAIVIAIPIALTGFTLLYFDLRVRKEEYNLDILAGELGLPGTTESAVATPPG